MRERRRSGTRIALRIGASGAALAILVVIARELARARTWQLAGEIVPRVATTENAVALTFDDGPTPHVRDVLAVLRDRGVRATFFLTGAEIEGDPDDARRIVEAGHQVGNHSWSHVRMLFRSSGFLAREIEETDRQLRRVGWGGEIVFRAPYGKKLVGLPWYLARHRRTHVTWDVEPESDPAIDGRTERIVAHVLAHARPGSIVLLHPMYPGREATRAAIAPIIDGLRARGTRLVTVAELLALRTRTGS